jgi:hypothetical protein
MAAAVKSPVAPMRTVCDASRWPARSRIWSLIDNSRRA